MPPTLFPALRKSAAGVLSTESKGVAFAAYYQALADSGIGARGRGRYWSLDRAVVEGYERLVWVFKSVNTVSADSARLPFRLRDGEAVVDDHPLYRVLNKKANPVETGQIFRKRLSSQVQLSPKGAFVERIKSNGGTVKELHLLPPDRVEIIPSLDGKGIEWFQFRRRNGTVKNFTPDEVLWFRDPHPIDPYLGVTPLEAAQMSVELDHFARLYNVSFMQNDGRPGGVLAVRNQTGGTGDITTTHMNRLEERFGKGPVEAGKLSVIAGELSYVDLATRPRDMQYGQTAANAKVEILAAFGVPESVLGNASGKTFDNADAELYTYWTRTMPAHNEILLSGFDEDSEDTFEGYFDTSTVEVLERTERSKRDEARTEVAAGLRSPKSYADLAGYGDEIDDNLHTRSLYMAQGKTPLPSRTADEEALGLGQPTDTGAPPATPPLPDGTMPGATGDAGDGQGAAPGQPADQGTTTGSTPTPPGQGSAPDSPGGPDDGIDWSALGNAPKVRITGGATGTVLRYMDNGNVEVKRDDGRIVMVNRGHLTKVAGGGGPKVGLRLVTKDGEPVDQGPWQTDEVDADAADRLEADLARALAALTERWLAKADTRLGSPKQRKNTRHWTPEYKADTRVGDQALDAARVVDEASWTADAENETHPIIEAAAVAAAIALLMNMGYRPHPSETIEQAAARVVRDSVASMVRFVGASAGLLARTLIGRINGADQAGEDLAGIRGIVAEFGDRAASWAEGLSVQTATATVNGARDDAATEAEASEHLDVRREWVTRHDDRVRPAHREADGQSRGLREPFIVGGSLLRFPGDPLAPIALTANCRCWLRYRHRASGRFLSPPSQAVG
jgi:HK97 family phage portal protein